MSSRTLNFAIILVGILTWNEANTFKSSIHPASHAAYDSNIRLSDGKSIRRDKRFLIYSGGGISKVVIGFSFPVETRDNVNWRTLNLAYNFQAQYVALPSAMFLWDRFSRSLIDQRQHFEAEGTFSKDLTRSLLYTAVETFLDRKGIPGRQCLLKAICDAAENPIERHNVFDEVVHLALTPHEGDADRIYVQAKQAGEFGVDCAELYASCGPSDGLLESISKLF